MVGAPAAAIRCIGPVSLPTASAARAPRAAIWAKSVRPVRSRARGAWRWIAWASALSCRAADDHDVEACRPAGRWPAGRSARSASAFPGAGPSCPARAGRPVGGVAERCGGRLRAWPGSRRCPAAAADSGRVGASGQMPASSSCSAWRSRACIAGAVGVAMRQRGSRPRRPTRPAGRAAAPGRAGWSGRCSAGRRPGRSGRGAGARPGPARPSGPAGRPSVSTRRSRGSTGPGPRTAGWSAG